MIYKLQHLFIENAPGIPLFTELSWAEYNSKYFIDFPNSENPYGPLSPRRYPSGCYPPLLARPRASLGRDAGYLSSWHFYTPDLDEVAGKIVDGGLASKIIVGG